ncbi:MAG: M1 family aminopeptidase [Rhizomicrobium sp.]
MARLIFVDKVPAGEATLIFDYDAPFDRSLAGLYKVVDRGDSYAFTQFESTDARRAFPSFDEPGFKTPFDMTVIAPKGMRVIGNTPIVAAAPAAHGMVDTVFQTTKPLPTYLVALAVGPLDVVDGGTAPPNAYRSRPLHIRGITARGDGKRIAYALALTPKIVTALETYFGIGYPFQKLDILAVPDFAAGAMENAGAITFRERYLLLDPDAPLDQKRGSLAVQAHELAHQWFGDLVTPAWWDDTWLNESFANWAEYKASAAVLPQMDFSTDTLRAGFDVMDLDELPSARQIHQPIANTDDLENAFDAITYDKGASVLRMFETYVGPANWQRGIHAYLTKYARGNATARDFVGTIAATTGHPEIVPAFGDFIDRSGVPLLKASLRCAPPALNFAQSAYAPFGFSAPQRSWRVPVCAMDGASRACRIGEGAHFALALTAGCTAMPLPNADGAGYYRFALDEADWQKQIALAPKMDAAGQITLMANVFSGLRNGQARAADAFELIHALAPVARWDVLASLTKRLMPLRQSLAPADLPAYRAFLSRNFLTRFKTMGVLGAERRSAGGCVRAGISRDPARDRSARSRCDRHAGGPDPGLDGAGRGQMAGAGAGGAGRGVARGASVGQGLCRRPGRGVPDHEPGNRPAQHRLRLRRQRRPGGDRKVAGAGARQDADRRIALSELLHAGRDRGARGALGLCGRAFRRLRAAPEPARHGRHGGHPQRRLRRGCARRCRDLPAGQARRRARLRSEDRPHGRADRPLHCAAPERRRRHRRRAGDGAVDSVGGLVPARHHEAGDARDREDAVRAHPERELLVEDPERFFVGVFSGRKRPQIVHNVPRVGDAQDVRPRMDLDVMEMAAKDRRAAFQAERGGAEIARRRSENGSRKQVQFPHRLGAVGGDDQRAGRPQHAGDLRYRPVLVRRVVEHVHRRHDVEAVVGEGQRADVRDLACHRAPWTVRGNGPERFRDHSGGLVGEREVKAVRQEMRLSRPDPAIAAADVEHARTGGDQTGRGERPRRAGRRVFVKRRARHQLAAVPVLALHVAHVDPPGEPRADDSAASAFTPRRIAYSGRRVVQSSKCQ